MSMPLHEHGAGQVHLVRSLATHISIFNPVPVSSWVPRFLKVWASNWVAVKVRVRVRVGIMVRVRVRARVRVRLGFGSVTGPASETRTRLGG